MCKWARKDAPKLQTNPNFGRFHWVPERNVSVMLCILDFVQAEWLTYQEYGFPP